MFSKFELIGAIASVGLMAMALYLVQVETSIVGSSAAQPAQVVQSGLVVVGDDEDVNQARADAYLEATDSRGNFERMVVDDIKIGEGEEVKNGDTVVVHYVGRLQNGQEFDNSQRRGEPFEFTVGQGRVIEGWEEGVIGMREGGQRVLVIPPEKAYGSEGVGPIPGNATLLFSIDLLKVK